MSCPTYKSTVLIVDDRPADRQLISEWLRKYYPLCVATRGAQALQVVFNAREDAFKPIVRRYADVDASELDTAVPALRKISSEARQRVPGAAVEQVS
ncbi:hypothetical protein C1886_09575 [Pseudomonas sp. FW300-N1A1]|uniref:response regulator n=1 Tax=Pseudomonas sp. FW300-N1A1 TaxID=2075555 RepID=UPI000CD073DB|nr:response regulator [Pseudomonas sp. FW300-N1A1]POA20278.1 hypothetical protein C1886_09575 [Pseudomonas sp. FW300-N1A1]